jgi:hypothetical protein
MYVAGTMTLTKRTGIQ